MRLAEVLCPENVCLAFIVVASAAILIGSIYFATHGMPEMCVLAIVPLAIGPIAFRVWRGR